MGLAGYGVGCVCAQPAATNPVTNTTQSGAIIKVVLFFVWRMLVSPSSHCVLRGV
jgi:hypothetical protein